MRIIPAQWAPKTIIGRIIPTPDSISSKHCRIIWHGMIRVIFIATCMTSWDVVHVVFVVYTENIRGNNNLYS